MKLKTIDLSRNQFTGSMPSEIDRYRNLQDVILSHNMFLSSIPSQIGNLQGEH